MLNHLGILLAGFSIVGCLILLFAYLFFLGGMRKSFGAKIACIFLLGSLVLLQLAHYQYFVTNINLLSTRSYPLLLILVPAFFYLFSRFVLFPEVHYKWFDLLHFLPALLSFVVSNKVIPSVAFLLGTAYTFWFSRIVFRLRQQQQRFKFEMFFFGLFRVC